MNLYKNGHGAKDKYLFHVSNESSNKMIQMDSLLICTQGYPYLASGFFKNNPWLKWSLNITANDFNII